MMGIATNGQALFAILLLILNTGYLAEALTLPTPFAYGEPGPAFLPLVLSGIMYIAAGRILIAELRGARDAETEGAPVEGTPLKPVIIALITAVFIYLFEYLGYWIATLIYTFAITALFEYEKKSSPLRMLTVSVIVAIAMTAIGWIFFVTLFDLFLPTGSW
ncbi:MAG TPA: tripartite tricarboxylate transporter TctB family protein [Paracoccaceae bacterium]|nr:tripartite tricarboxylate transporter TctB family protein [Paracoccaceae bacterium]